MTDSKPILVAGAAGAVGAVGRQVVEALRAQDRPVRAVVRQEDDRSQALKALGAEIVCADLTRPDQVLRALQGCSRVYFSTSIGAAYLEANLSAIAAAREVGLEVFVNMSQFTVSDLRIDRMSASPQHRHGWMAEQAMAWSGIPVVQVRATIFMQAFFLRWAAMSIARDDTLRFPFGTGKTSPIASQNVAEVVTKLLTDPTIHAGKAYHLSGPSSMDMETMAGEYSAALGRRITYVDTPHEAWVETWLRPMPLPEHLRNHLEAMARMHHAGDYDRYSDDFEKLMGRPPMPIGDFVRANAASFPGPAAPS